MEPRSFQILTAYILQRLLCGEPKLSIAVGELDRRKIRYESAVLHGLKLPSYHIGEFRHVSLYLRRRNRRDERVHLISFDRHTVDLSVRPALSYRTGLEDRIQKARSICGSAKQKHKASRYRSPAYPGDAPLPCRRGSVKQKIRIYIIFFQQERFTIHNKYPSLLR